MRYLLPALLLCCASLSAQTFTAPNFTVDTIANPGYGTISIDFGPGGLMYVAEKRGRVLVLQPNGSGGYNPPTVFADLTAFVDYNFECGLLGLALDPDFATNRHMFVFYTTPTDQRLMRVTADAGYLNMTGGQTSILTGLPRSQFYHNAGDIEFAPGEPNNIYVALGDDGDIGNARDLNYYAGKILRVNKTNGEGLTTNPFYSTSTTSIRSRIWATGFRNPFRIGFHPNMPNADVMYISENGGPPNTTGNTVDRICRAEMGTDGNWDWTAYNAGDASAFYNPVNPSGDQCEVMQRDIPSLIGIEIARGGAFADPANPGSDVMLVGNWVAGSGSISRWRMTGAELDTLTPIAADGGNRFVTNLYATDLKFGPDGWLYFTQSGNDESVGGWYTIGRIRYVGGQPPVASFTTNPSPATGPAPLNVSFTDTSTDPDNTIVSWDWDFGDGTNSTAQSPSHTFTNPAVYTVTLTVEDATGLQDTVQMTVDAYQATSLTLNGTVFDARVSPPVALAVATELYLYEADGVTPLSFAGGLGAGGNGIAVAGGGSINSVVSV